MTKNNYNVVLSSGYMAFSRHCAFLKAVDDHALSIDSLIGTSSGAISGAMYCAGHDPEYILREIATVKFMDVTSVFPFDFKGMFNLSPAKDYLKRYLPQTFDELPVKFSCGVSDLKMNHLLIDSGDLISAVCASFAIPKIFKPVYVNGVSGGPYIDGGVVDRLGLFNDVKKGTLSNRGRILIHKINKSHKISSDNNYEKELTKYNGIKMIKSDTVNESLFKVKYFNEQYEYSRAKIYNELRTILDEQNS
ncbi:patatin-like phospholipase family protein [Salmonella enterica]